MSEKLPRNQRRKLAEAVRQQAEPPRATPAEVVRRRRYRRFLLLVLIAVALPLLEVVAYQYRGILIIVVNNSDEVVKNVKFAYPGGSFEEKELKPGGEVTHLARPNYNFSRESFSTYSIRVSAVGSRATFSLIDPKTGTVDYSARETYAIEPEETPGVLKFNHKTRPGFPLGTIRDLLTKLGVG